jgi:hypothetical protein
VNYGPGSGGGGGGIGSSATLFGNGGNAGGYGGGGGAASGVAAAAGVRGSGTGGLVVLTYTVVGGTTYASTVSETATGTDTLASSVTFLTSIVESATATDSVAVIVTFNAETAETATASDIAEAVKLTIIAASIDEQVTAVDVVVVAPSTLNVTTDEIVTALDSIDAGFVYNVEFVDAATVTDATEGILTIGSSISESVTAQQLVSSSALFSSTILEALISNDNYSNTIIRFDYEAVKDLYSRKRTVYVSRTSLPSDRVVLVSAMDRTVYVSRTSLPSDRVVLSS